MAAPMFFGHNVPTTGIATGYRSLLAFWLGGAAALPTAAEAGYRSIAIFWLGGATVITATQDERKDGTD